MKLVIIIYSLCWRKREDILFISDHSKWGGGIFSYTKFATSYAQKIKVKKGKFVLCVN
jgi:hypothetical protein